MKRTLGTPTPKMREAGLIIDELKDEVLVYDLARHKAHCLNQTAALVWQHCDGRSQPREIAHRMQQKLDESFSEEMVWLALRQLHKNHLLEASIELPPRQAGMSRREMVRSLGIAAAVAAPLITSIVSPTAVQASTCVPHGGSCTTSSQCCSKLCKSNNTCQ